MSVIKPADRACRGCRDEYRVTEDSILRMLSHPMFRPESGLCVPDAVYEARISQCRACPKLIGGHTCSLCGCIVDIAARLKAKRCPLPGGKGWESVGGDAST